MMTRMMMMKKRKRYNQGLNVLYEARNGTFLLLYQIGEGEKEEESDEEDSEDIEPPVQPQQVEEKKKESKVTLPQAESGNKKRKAEVPVGSPLKPAKQRKGYITLVYISV